jgi:hypothetical protein
MGNARERSRYRQIECNYFILSSVSMYPIVNGLFK